MTVLIFFQQYIDLCLVSLTPELFKLVEALDMSIFQNKLQALEPYSTTEWYFFFLNEILLQKLVLDQLLTLSYGCKFLFLINSYLVKFFFLWISPLTFWCTPSIFLFFCGLILLFLIKPLRSNLQIWNYSKIFIFFIFLYQIALIYYFLSLQNLGIILKVGLAGAFNLPFNLSLAKLFSLAFIIFALFATFLFYLEYYTKILLQLKPEICPILFFLGFGSGMAFLQNDLFSLFLYFEIISFCIYGVLFLQRWTNAQLHSLVRYVLFSLWVSTCYILGIALYLAAKNSSTNLFEFNSSASRGDDYAFKVLLLDNFRELLLVNFELFLAIAFILIYFLFKLGAGPFYTWTIEVYNACSSAGLFVVSILPKLVYVPILFFILFYNFIEFAPYWSNLLAAVGFITVFIGSFGILLTDKLKEIYAWSSVIHTGNILIILSCVSAVTLTFVMFYLFSYYLISYGFIILITSVKNKFTGWFIKTVGELFGLVHLNENFSFLAIILLASAAGFTPFLSFFMKFSMLTLISTHYGIVLTVLVGLMNIIGGVAYLWMLRNIIGFNLNFFHEKTKDSNVFFLEVKMSYNIAGLFNLVIFIILISFFFYKDFIYFFSYTQTPMSIGDDPASGYLSFPFPKP